MDSKTLRQDLVYFCKRFIKDGFTISQFDGNLSIKDGKFVLSTKELCALEMMIIGREYLPPDDMSDDYNISIPNIIELRTGIDRLCIHAFLDGYQNVTDWLGFDDNGNFGPLKKRADIQEKFHAVGKYIGLKFLPNYNSLDNHRQRN